MSPSQSVARGPVRARFQHVNSVLRSGATRIEARLRAATPGTFTYRGYAFTYFVDVYNATWRNERAIEIPIALHALRGRVLEVGNVLHHYSDHRHDVVDKYEQAPGVANVDIVDFRTDARYDTIISISTIEHVGWDEDVKDPDKPRRAIDHLRSLLAPGGTLLVTIPLGYNPTLDPEALGFDRVDYLRRVPGNARAWEETSAAEVAGTPYGPFANAMAFGWSRA